MIKKKLALFPSYVFFATDFPDQLNLLLDDIPMYSKVLSYDLKPIPIEESEQEFLQQLINKENTVQTSTGIIEGDNLIILQGPLVGKEGEVIKIDRHKRTATLKVDFLGTTRIVKLGLEVVSKV